MRRLLPRAILSLVFACMAIASATPSATAGPACDPAAVVALGFEFTPADYPRWAIPGDFDEDGIFDLAVLINNWDAPSGSIEIHYGQGAGGVGDGTFAPGPTYPLLQRPLALITEDVNEDGILDLLATNWGSGALSVLLGNGTGGVGDGTFGTPQHTSVATNPFYLRTADFDEDDILDIVIADNGAGALRILKGQGSGGVGNGTFSLTQTVQLRDLPLSVIVGDFNEDTHVDVVTTVGLLDSIAVFLGDGSGTFADFGTQYFGGAQPYELATDDMNADDIADIVISNGTWGGVAVLLGNGAGGVGDGTFAAPLLQGVGEINGSSVVIHDFDEDGVKDVIVSSTLSDVISFMPGTGTGALGSPVANVLGSFPIGMSTADFNEDGKLDISIVNWSDTAPRVKIFEGQCVSEPPPPLLSPVLDGVRDVPNDQGGSVFVVWRASAADTDENNSVTGYRVWRRIPAFPEGLAAEQVGSQYVERRGGPVDVDVTYWEAVAELPAQRLEGYGYAAATTQDSIPGSNPFTAFFVTALTGDPGTFYSSNVDSGYSVDNLAPPPPTVFVGQIVGGSGYALHWNPSDAPDVLGYRLHRNADPDFVPGPSNLISAQPDTGHVDVPTGALEYYKLAAVDVHGNVGGFVVLPPAGATPALISIVSVDVSAERVKVQWYTDVLEELGVERRVNDAEWEVVTEVFADGSGRVFFEDASPVTGAHIDYRLRWDRGGEVVYLGETGVDVPRWAFALHGMSPNPFLGGPMEVRFTLPRAGVAHVRLVDLTGRVVAARESSFHAGEQRIVLRPSGRMSPGIYFVQLTQEGEKTVRKVSVLR